MAERIAIRVICADCDSEVETHSLVLDDRLETVSVVAERCTCKDEEREEEGSSDE